jgi:acetylornithine/succinyldiaminopimelate/putrescine aminotransferase
VIALVFAALLAAEAEPPPCIDAASELLRAGNHELAALAAERCWRTTSNPRALDVACTVLDLLTPQVRENIRTRGMEAMEKLEKLKSELGGLITKVQGTGLLFSCELAPQFKCYGAGSTEEWLRERGLNVIHGGDNSLRFTPHFAIDSEELDLLVTLVGQALRKGPRAEQAVAA